MRVSALGWLVGVVALVGLGGCDDGSGDAGRVDRGGSDATGLDATPDAESDTDTGPDTDTDPPADIGPDTGPPPGPPVTLTAQAVTLRAAPDPGVIELDYGDAQRLRISVTGFVLGVVPAIDDRTNYDPQYLYRNELHGLPAGLVWHPARRLAAALDGAALVITLDHGPAGLSTVRFEATEDRIAARWLPPAGPVAFLRLQLRADPSEGFYGLGEVFDTPDHRGRVRAMQLALDLELESANNEAHVPVPLLIGSTGWGLFLASLHPAAFSVAVDEPDLIDLAVGLGPDAAAGLDLHLFATAHPLDITRRYYDVTGYPRLPAPWALGPWIWRDENRDQQQVIDDIETLRDLDLATTGIWVDRPYASGVSSFDFNPAQFPDPQAMIDRAHALGLRFALWHTAYVGEDQPATADLHAEALARGYYPDPTGPIINNWGRPVDLTHPEAYAWWQALVRRYTAMGVEGFKLDYVEDIVVGLYRTRSAWGFADGSTERTMHKRYQTLYHRVFAETLPATGGFLLTRTGTWGGQTNGNIIWPGDLDANMARHRERVVDGEDTYIAVGGLPAAMVAGLSLGPSGYPFYGSDTGGYRHCPPDAETFTRWFQQTALSSVMQIGTSCNDVAWEPTPENGFDAALLDTYRRYVRLHLRLWPYAWTLATDIARTGHPLQRPYGLQHPELGRHPWDIYFFGDALLVAPVVERGARDRTVPFPPGGWFDWWTGARFEGGADQTVPAPLDTLPLFIRAGAIVPLLRPTIDTLAPTTEPERVDSFATNPGLLHLVIALGADGALTLYDGTAITHRAEANDHRITLAPGAAGWRGFVLEVVGGDDPASVEVDGQPLEPGAEGWRRDDSSNRLLIPLPAAAREVRLRT